MPTAAIRPSVIVICGRSMTRPVSTSIIRSALTTTLSAYAAVTAPSASAVPEMMAAQKQTVVFILFVPYLLPTLSREACSRFDLRQHYVEPWRVGTTYRRKGNDVFKDVLHVPPGFVVGDVFNPYIGIRGLQRLPSCDSRRTCIVGGETQSELLPIAIQQFAQVRGAQRHRDRRIKQAVAAG